MITEFFIFTFILVLVIDVALHLRGKPTFSNLVHSLAPQVVDYGIYAVIMIAVFVLFGKEALLYVAFGATLDHLFGERKNDLK